MREADGAVRGAGAAVREAVLSARDGGTVWVGTSWKMNKTLPEALAFADALLEDEPGAPAGIARFVVPPFTAAREVKARLAGTRVAVGAQNVHWAEAGAWTGEISAPMLVDCGLDLVELGHSERRAHFGETDETVGLKVAAAVAHALVPLVCVGETREARDADRADETLEAQVRGALAGLGAGVRDAPVLFAYEPVWAIGEGGEPASADYADARQGRIKAVARDALGTAPPCLYGGSVNADNCASLIVREHVDGLFVGRAAWDAHGYLDLLSRCAAALAGERPAG